MNKRTKRIVSAILLVLLCMGNIFISDMTCEAASKKALNITDMIMSKGQNKQLRLSGVKKVSWKSSNKSVAVVSKKGKVTAKKKGKAVITAKVNGKSYKCNVTVSQPTRKQNDILIVYFSQTGTTKAVANKIQKLTGGDLLRIREKNKYPSDYDKTVERAKKELDKKSHPAISTKAVNMKSYDIVYVGFPVWWHSTPRVINTFLEQYDLKEKTVVPFCTSGGSDISETLPELRKSCSGAEILEGYTADAGTKAEIRSWLIKIGQLQSTTVEETPDVTIIDTPEPTIVSKKLVVYFSMPETTNPDNMTVEEANSTVVINGEVLGNTQYVAHVIQANTDADIFRIEPETPYPTDHNTLVDLAAAEQNQAARPVIKSHIEDMKQYDTVFIGYPNWWGDMPMILYSFFDEYDLAGKTIIPFNTHGGSGFSNTIRTIADLEPDAIVNENGFTVSRNNVQEAEGDIIAWLKENGF